jgi:hypothetical protein
MPLPHHLARSGRYPGCRLPLYAEKDGQKTRYGFIEGYKSHLPVPFTVTELHRVCVCLRQKKNLLSEPLRTRAKRARGKKCLSQSPQRHRVLGRFSEGKVCHTGILLMHEDHSPCSARGGLSLLSDSSSQRIGQIYSLSLCELERSGREKKSVSHRGYRVWVCLRQKKNLFPEPLRSRATTGSGREEKKICPVNCAQDAEPSETW